MSISRRERPRPAGVGPFEVGRARYFALRNEANRERRRNAETRIRILEANLTLQLNRLAQFRNDTDTHDLTRAERIERDRAAQRQARHVDDIRSELVKQRQLRTMTHDDRLTEWAVEHDGRRLPSPGHYLLARRSTKPFPQHPTA